MPHDIFLYFLRILRNLYRPRFWLSWDRNSSSMILWILSILFRCPNAQQSPYYPLFDSINASLAPCLCFMTSMGQNNTELGSISWTWFWTTLGNSSTPMPKISVDLFSEGGVWITWGQYSNLWPYLPQLKQIMCKLIYSTFLTCPISRTQGIKVFVRSTSTHTLANRPLRTVSVI